MRFLQADAIFDGTKFLSPGLILVVNSGREPEDLLEPSFIEPSRIERYEGLICPGFVNAHSHLELSHLKGKIPEGTGLPGFGKQIIGLSGKFHEGEMLEHMQDADRYMFENGITATGDISNTPLSFRIKADSPIVYHTFVELIGLNPAMARERFEQGLKLVQELEHKNLRASLCAHAPYSVSAELFHLISNWCEATNQPTSIHNQESPDEIKFLCGEKSGFDELYAFLGQDLSWYKAPGKSGLNYLSDLIPKKLSMLVHNTLSTAQDVGLSEEMENHWCFCPRANLYIEKQTPDFKLFQSRDKFLCLGTDSLASNHDLNILNEANIILSSGAFNLETVLRMLTSQGADALGLSEEFGQIRRGKHAGLNLLSYRNQTLSFKKKIM